MEKLDCKDCKQKCCEGYLYVRATKEREIIILLPLSRKKIKVDGIPLKRITDRLWRCEWFNKKTGKCKNYYKRPKLCKVWFCRDCKKQSTKTHHSEEPYGLGFTPRLIRRRY